MNEDPTQTYYTTKNSNPILESYKEVSNKLEYEQAKVKSNDLKLKNLTKKISGLQLLNRHSQRQSMRYQRQLEKLENTQQYATELLKMKYQNFREIENENNHRYNSCLTQRTQMERNRYIAMSIFEQRKQQKIRKSREEKERVVLELQKSYREIANETKQRIQEVRLQEQRVRDRRHRYEMFKMQRAALNHQKQIEEEYSQLRDNSRILSQLKLKAHKAEQLFRKTQMLDREATKIQSIYLTDC